MQQLIEKITTTQNIREEQVIHIFDTIKEYVAVNFPAAGNFLDFVFTDKAEIHIKQHIVKSESNNPVNNFNRTGFL
jgi:hypothetical protein